MSWRCRIAPFGLLLALGSCDGTAWASPANPSKPALSPESLIIEAPDSIGVFLRRHMALSRALLQPDLSAVERERLLAQLEPDVRQLLGTLGHFSPRIAIESMAGANPADPSAPAAPGLRIRVEPGPLSRVAELDLRWARASLSSETPTHATSHSPSNPTADSGPVDQAQQQWAAAWTLALGQVFTQADWDEAKSDALNRLTAYRYPSARIIHSRAEVDAQQQRVRLELTVDPGPATVYGAIVVQGARRLKVQTVQQWVELAGVRRGRVTDDAQMLQAQSMLLNSGDLDSAFLMLDPAAPGSATPLAAGPGAAVERDVIVQVREPARTRSVVGVGVNSTLGARLSLEHTNHEGWWGRRMVWRGLLDRKTLTAALDSTASPGAGGWRSVVGVQASRLQDGELRTDSGQFRTGRIFTTPTQDRSVVAQIDASQAETDDPGFRSDQQMAVSGVVTWSRRQFDNLRSPRQGHGLSVEWGLGSTVLPERSPFMRTRLRGLFIRPASPGGVLKSGQPSGRAVMRVEAGGVWADSRAEVPTTQRFQAGGDGSVRGYGPREIGVLRPGGGVDAGRFLLAGSLEWQQPMDLRFLQSNDWEWTAFVDAAAVADRRRELHPRSAMGTGLRYSSPLGPLQMDLAYGLHTRRWRLHLGVGFAF